MLCQKLNHAAYRCKDARKTVDFYTEVLGLKFSHAVGGDHVPSTGQYDPHIHVFFEMADGSSIAFFEVPRAAGGVRDETMPDWIQHFAFEVEDEEALEKAKVDMEARGMDVLGPTDHGFIKSIYFHDPSGHRLELTTRIRGREMPAGAEAEASRLLDLWEQTHDWSGAQAAAAVGEGYNVHG
jgi:catechol 2,3-dioxygenase-like lactoylglutathione lyase family enzyme